MTAEEFLNDKYQNDLNSYQDNVESLIEFAKHHVEQALKEVYEQNEEILVTPQSGAVHCFIII